MKNNTRFTEQLDQDGFFVWSSLLPPDLIDRHLDAYATLNARLGVKLGESFYSHPSEKQAAIRQARSDFHVENIEAQRMIFNHELMRFLQDYFGDEPVMRGPQTGLYHRRTPDHTDSLDSKVSPRGAEVRIWCALEDIHPDSGPVYFVPGSHRAISEGLEREVLTEHPEFIDLLRSQMKPTTAEEYFSVTKPLWDYVKLTKLTRAIEEIGLERRPLLLKKGDIIVFSPDVVHGTCRCNDLTLTRKVFVASWAAVSAVWYESRAYWGPYHDYRHPENSITLPVYRTPLGLGVSSQEFQAAYFASFKKAVVQHSCDPPLLLVSPGLTHQNPINE
jgi:phytanoyl-CoA dioxygenase PhyH